MMGSFEEINSLNNLNHFRTSGISKTQTTTQHQHHQEQQYAVSVRNAFKKYSSRKESNYILNNFNMTVKEGNIYSLLGSSGCGKTTLLSCIVGLRSFDNGEVLVFNEKPGSKGSGVPGRRVGYMPQEIALYGEFSIKEVLIYYGRLYGMPKWEVEDNTKFLVTFLNLPPENRRINTLSGGQQRRVSFAVALIHNPELLILDEPTVGVDPLLRQNIWSHLVKLAQISKTTIIITTHFIEEARDSNCIGLMRNGKLLAEDSPTALMDKYNTYILEDIVVQLCLKDTNSEEENTRINSTTNSDISNNIIISSRPISTKVTFGPVVDGPDLISNPDDNSNNSSPLPSPSSQHPRRRQSLGQVLHRASNTPKNKKLHSNTNTFIVDIKEKSERIYALLTKNVLVLLRNIVFVFFIVGVPAFQVVLICLAIGKDPHGIKLGVVNNEVGINGCNNLSIKSGCIMSSQLKYGSFASCEFISQLSSQVFKLIFYENESQGIDDVKKTKIWGLMSFPFNFTEHLKERVEYGVYSVEESLKLSRITFHLDMSNTQIGLQIKKNLYSTLQEFMKKLAKGCKVDTSGLDTPLFFDTPVYGNDDTNFTEFLAPGVLLSILFFFPLCSTGVSMIMEKKSGALERTKVAGVTDFEMMVSHFITQIVLLICQSILSFIIMVSVFQIRIHGSIFLALLVGNLIGVSGISFGFFMALVCRDELEAVMLSLGTFMPNFILSGAIWPLEGMPFYLQHISYILPCTLAGESLRSIIGRGVTFTHRAVWPGFLSTISYTALYWILTLIISKIRKVN